MISTLIQPSILVYNCKARDESLLCSILLYCIYSCTLREKQPVYIHSMLAASLPSHSLRSNNDNSLSVPRVKTTQAQKLFTLVPRPSGTTCRCLSVQPVQLLPSRHIWRHISLTWPFSHRHRHAWWPVDITELSSILLLNTDSPVTPQSLATSGILALQNVYLLIYCDSLHRSVHRGHTLLYLSHTAMRLLLLGPFERHVWPQAKPLQI